MHWYTAKGQPLYEVARVKGKGTRPTTLADARKLNLYPSVTSIIGQIAKPGLEKWKFEQLLIAFKATAKRLSLHDPLFDNETYKESLKTSQEVTKLGTEIHNALETYYKTGIYSRSDFKTIVQSTHKAITEKLKISDWEAEPSFAHYDGFGGKIDLISKKGVVIDFKTKRGTQEDLDKLVLFDDYGMQLAAYRKGIRDLLPPTKKKIRCFNVLISVDNPGAVSIREWDEKDLIKYERMFYKLLRFWQIRNKMEVH